MIQTVEGIFRDGRVELLETPHDIRESRVLVTFLPAPPSSEESMLTLEEAAELPTMTTKRGAVVLVQFPRSDLRTFDRRPALVVRADGRGTGLPQIVLAMITTNLSRAGHPSRVLVRLSSPAGIASGLLADSVIMTDNLATVLEKAVHSVIGNIPDRTDVDTALRATLAL